MLLLDQTPVYWAATILHPGLMMRWVHLAMPSKAELIEQRVESFFIEGWCCGEAIPQRARPSSRGQPMRMTKISILPNSMQSFQLVRMWL